MNKFFTSALALLAFSVTAGAADGDIFEIDGLSYRVVSESDKTCEVAPNRYFEGAANVSEIAGGYTVVALGEDAFWCAEHITEITLPQTLRTIKKNAVSRVFNIKEVVIPNGVSTIESRAFYGSLSLERVTLPASITELNSETFSGCTMLGEITIPDNVTKINNEVFNYSGLRSVTIGKGVQTIGVMAFSGCGKLTSFSVPANVSLIESEAFSYCPALTDFTIEDGERNLTFGSKVFGQGGSGYISSQAHITNLYVGRQFSCTVTDAIEQPFSIGSWLTSITFGPKVSTVPTGAFNATPVAEITLMDGVSSIAKNAFSNCTKLMKISLMSWDAPRASTADFSSQTLGGATIVVPLLALQHYQSNEFWSSFSHLTSINVALPFEMTLDPGQIELTKDETATLAPMFSPADLNADGLTLSWSSADETIATVSSDGVVTPMANGSSVITLTATVIGSDTDKVTATCAVTVSGMDSPDGPDNPDSIITVDADSAPSNVSMFDLQGRPSSADTPGLYIERTVNGKSRKIIKH